MPRERVHASNAEKQKSYRERCYERACEEGDDGIFQSVIHVHLALHNLARGGSLLAEQLLGVTFAETMRNMAERLKESDPDDFDKVFARLLAAVEAENQKVSTENGA